MKQYYTTILALVGLAVFGFQCRPEPPEHAPYVPPQYKFAEKLSLSPYKKTYTIGDTIWVKFETTDKTLFDEMTGSRIPADTMFLDTRFLVNKRPPGDATEYYGEVQVDSVTNITFQPWYTWYNILKFKTACNSNRYYFRVAYVPKKTGIYSLEPSAEVSPCPNKKNYLYTTFKFTFDLADCNKDIWLSIPPGQRDGEMGTTDVRIDKKEIFIFKVQ